MIFRPDLDIMAIWIFRYNILGGKALSNAKNEKMAAKILFDIVGLETEKYRLGHTKVRQKTHCVVRNLYQVLF